MVQGQIINWRSTNDISAGFRKQVGRRSLSSEQWAGGYNIVRHRAQGTVHLEVDAELKARVIQHMQGQRAGGRFGSEGDGKWYPIDLALAKEIPDWNGPQTGFDIRPDRTPDSPGGSGR